MSSDLFKEMNSPPTSHQGVTLYGERPASLLCQMGFASRVGAVWVTRKLTASFTDTEGYVNWRRENAAFPGRSGVFVVHPQPWSHKAHDVPVEWNNSAPQRETLTRIMAGTGRTATVCGLDLSPGNERSVSYTLPNSFEASNLTLTATMSIPPPRYSPYKLKCWSENI